VPKALPSTVMKEILRYSTFIMFRFKPDNLDQRFPVSCIMPLWPNEGRF
jgi:hypothetical protein